MTAREHPEVIESVVGTAGPAFAELALNLRVTGVDMYFAPVGQSDVQLAAQTAVVLLDLLTQEIEIDEETQDLLLSFGAAVGALTTRQLFEPFQADEIAVRYRAGSGLDQRDATRRVVKGLRVEPLQSDITRMLED